jgi:hypothetical protein
MVKMGVSDHQQTSPLECTRGHAVDLMGLAPKSLVDSFLMKLRHMLSHACSIFKRILWPNPRSSRRGSLSQTMRRRRG